MGENKTCKAQFKFDESIKIACLLWCSRHCCMCGKSCGDNIELHHIIPKKHDGKGTVDNAIPVCYECHAMLGHYNIEHPKGNKFREKEQQARRDQIYEEHTRHLIPPIFYEVTQDYKEHKYEFPKIGFAVKHHGHVLPSRLLVYMRVFSNGKEKDEYIVTKSGLYHGSEYWYLNPFAEFYGYFKVLEELGCNMASIIVIAEVAVVDAYGRAHKRLPALWKYRQEENKWVPNTGMPEFYNPLSISIDYQVRKGQLHCKLIKDKGSANGKKR